MPNKTVANLVINAPEFGLNDSFEIEDTAARAAADAAASTAASTAATVQTMGTRLTAVETKDTQQDTAIENAVEAIAGKTQIYTTAGGVNTPYPQLRIGTGLDVNNGVLSASGGGGDISALTARVAALETNDGIQDTDIDNLQTRMGTAENDIDALEANDVTLSMEKTGLYVNSGGTNSYYTDLALGTGLAVTNGVLDVVGGGGGGGFAQCTAIADANDATTPGLYCPASSSATNFPAGADITDLHSGTLIVSTYGSGQNKNLIQQVFIENYNGSSTSAQLGNAKIWLRVQSNNHIDWPFPSDVTSFKSWQLVASAIEDYVQDIVYAKDGISLVSTSYADPTKWPADLEDQVVYAIVITMTTDNNIAGSFDGTQVLITDSGKAYVRTKWQGSWLTWISIGGGGGSTGPTKIAAGTDLDTVTDAGEYYFNGGYMGNMPQWPGMFAPSSGEGNTPYFMTVRKRPFGGDSGTTYLIEQEIAATDNESQGFVTSTKNTIRHISRVKINNGSWSPWVSQDTAMTCADCNLACRTGKYWITSSTNNKPSGMGNGDIGIMEVAFESGSTGYIVIQRITTADKIYVRNNTTAGYNTQGLWGAWKFVTLS